MNHNTFVSELYHAVDSQDVYSISEFLTSDATMTFSNLPPVQGKMEISKFLTGFFQSIESISHTELEYWFTQDVCFVTGKVKYVRRDDCTLRVPFGVLFKLRVGQILEWNIFVDNSALYQ
jgi:ketosteroid isomerase-like protein